MEKPPLRISSGRRTGRRFAPSLAILWVASAGCAQPLGPGTPEIVFEGSASIVEFMPGVPGVRIEFLATNPTASEVDVTFVGCLWDRLVATPVSTGPSPADRESIALTRGCRTEVHTFTALANRTHVLFIRVIRFDQIPMGEVLTPGRYRADVEWDLKFSTGAVRRVRVDLGEFVVD